MPTSRPTTAGRSALRPRAAGRRALAAALALGLVLGAAACARVSSQTEQTTARGLPRPNLIVVRDYRVAREDVALDSGIRSRGERLITGTPEEQAQIKVEQAIVRVGTETLVTELRKLGFDAQPAAMAPPPGPGPTLAIEGQVLSIDEGNATRRMMLGFGAGASEVRTLTQVYEVTGGAHRLVEDFYTTARSSLKPGLGPMAGAGGMMGRAVQGAVGAAGVGLATERSQTAEADAQHGARQIARQLAKFFVVQGWITQAQADTLQWDR